MDNLIIQKLENKKELPWNLLLLADPSKEAIERYIYDSDIYLAKIDTQVIGEFVLVSLSPNIIELKNIAVDEKYQGQGVGKQLVLSAIKKAQDSDAKSIEVGTGNSSLKQLTLYQKCGYKIIGIDKDFFIKNYREEIIENGVKCTDMVRLVIDLKSK